MCDGCYAEYGMPRLVNDRVLKAAALAEAVYEINCVGGSLHVQLDDWNLEDEHFEDDFFKEIGVIPNDAEAACFAAFKGLTIEERASALALVDGYLGEDGILDPVMAIYLNPTPAQSVSDERISS